MNKLPVKLKNEPLIDVIFELRFSTTVSFSNIFPGLCFGNLEGIEKIEPLPVAELSKLIRDSDPNLQFAPILRIHWKNNYFILVGDRSVAVSCKIPYQGWHNFKAVIMEVIDLLDKNNIIDKVHRFALKYVDLIQADKARDQSSYLKFDINLGGHKLKNENFHFRFEDPKAQAINVVQIAAYAKAQLPDGSIQEGLLIDIDTINDANDQLFKQFKSNISEQLDIVHDINKQAFFNCLTDETLKFLDPQYE